MPRRRVPLWDRCRGSPRHWQPLTPGDGLPGQDPTYRSPCLPPLLGFTSTRRGCVPGRGLIWRAESTAANTRPLRGLARTRGRAHRQPGMGTYLQSLPIHRGGVELEGLVVLRASAGRGVALRSPAVGLPVLWGTEAWTCTLPREGSAGSQGRQVSRGDALPGPCHPAARIGTYQDDGADVGRQQDVVPQQAPIALRLHVGGTFIVELEGVGGRDVGQGTPGCL